MFRSVPPPMSISQKVGSMPVAGSQSSRVTKDPIWDEMQGKVLNARVLY